MDRASLPDSPRFQTICSRTVCRMHGNMAIAQPHPCRPHAMDGGQRIQHHRQDSKLGVTPFEWLWRAGEQGSSGRDALSTLDIDHSVPPVANVRGGRDTAVRMLREFLSNRLSRYHEDRNQVKNPATSGLSPWFHFGHLSTVEVVQRILDSNGWMPDIINAPRRGARTG